MPPSSDNANPHEATLSTYMSSFLERAEGDKFPRKKCCGTSRSLYCTECCQLLIERERWPLPIQTGHLDLPFNLDIILSDRRLSATGFHAHVLLQASLGYNHVSIRQESSEDEDTSTSLERVRLFDIENGESIPSYEGHDSTFVLFPSNKSVPLSSVSKSIHRLIVLDCKWTKAGTQQRLPEIADLPQVHLDTPPSESFFWRWHNAGSGMCSTLEAIYCAALEVAESKDDFTDANRDALIHLMWLFGIQRAASALGSKRKGKPLPFSIDGKDLQRDLRRTEKGSEKHLRDIENGLRLREEAKAKTRI